MKRSYKPWPDMTIEVGHGFESPFRIDVAVLEKEGRRVEERFFATGAHDLSDHHSIYLSYDSRCSACWLNHSHTRDYHHAQIASAAP